MPRCACAQTCGGVRTWYGAPIPWREEAPGSICWATSASGTCGRRPVAGGGGWYGNRPCGRDRRPGLRGTCMRTAVSDTRIRRMWHLRGSWKRQMTRACPVGRRRHRLMRKAWERFFPQRQLQQRQRMRYGGMRKSCGLWCGRR